MADRIVLTGLQFFARHGVHSFEAERGQVFSVDVELELDLAPAGQSDSLDLTVDYGAVYRDVQAVVAEGPRRQLIETVAEATAARLLARYPVQAVTVRVHKPRAPLPGAFAGVYVEVRRARAGDGGGP